MKRNLDRIGEFEIVRLASDQPLEPWLDEFMRLEAAGWKGQAGTAMACKPADDAYLRAICQQAFRRKRLMGLSLRLNGRTIASQMNIRGAKGVFGFKTAYDEQYGRYSPGMMMVIEAMRQLAAEGDVRWLDSCAAPDNDALKRMWKDRRTMGTFLCPLNRRGAVLASVLPLARYVTSRFRRRWCVGSQRLGGLAD